MPDGTTASGSASGPEEAVKYFSALAEELAAIEGSVTRDVNKLKKFGLLRLRERGQSRDTVVQIVEPWRRSSRCEFPYSVPWYALD